jgi:hypothetical protein
MLSQGKAVTEHTTPARPAHDLSERLSTANHMHRLFYPTLKWLGNGMTLKRPNTKNALFSVLSWRSLKYQGNSCKANAET